MISAECQNKSDILEVQPPYNKTPKLLARLYEAANLAIGENDDLFVAYWSRHAPVVQRFVAPSYERAEAFRMPGKIVNAIAALANGEIAIVNVTSSRHETKPGGAFILKLKSGKYLSQKIPGFRYPWAIIADPKNDLFIGECSECYGAGDGDNFIAEVEPPYDKISKMIAKIPGIDVAGLSIDAQRSLYAKEAPPGVTEIVRFPYPYERGIPVAQTRNVESWAVSPSGEIAFNTRKDRDTLFLLKAPLRGKPIPIGNVSPFAISFSP